MLKMIVGILIVLWLLGFVGHIGGGLIHLLLVIAAIVLGFRSAGRPASEFRAPHHTQIRACLHQA